MNQDLISIIVPVYGVEKYLHACVDSILAQTYQNLEVILIDDGSPDHCGVICDEYALCDGRVKVIHQSNAGAACAKNTGLNAAQGDYITFVDSDDWVDPDWIEKMLSAAVSRDADIVECNFRMEYVNDSEYGNVPDSFTEAVFATKDYLRDYPTQWSCAVFWNKLFRASLLTDVRFHEERRCIDDEFFTYKAVGGANRLYRIPDNLYHYRQRRSSVTQSEKNMYQRTIDNIDILVERHQWMKDHYPDIAMDYLRHDVDTLLYFAGTSLFNQKAIDRFRATARYYLLECLRNFPGKLTFYYALRSFFYKDKYFRSQPLPKAADDEMNKYFC